MPEYLSPGVYVEEIEIGGKPIEGVSTSTAGFLGETERGPTEPRLITGFAQYERLYGWYAWKTQKGESSKSFLPYAVAGFFANGGQRCFVGRIVGKKSSKAEGKLRGKETIEISAVGPGAWRNRIGAAIQGASTAKPGQTTNDIFKLVVHYWADMPPAPIIDPNDRKEFKNANRKEPEASEEFDNLSWDPDSPDYYLSRIQDNSSLIEVRKGEASAATGSPPVTASGPKKARASEPGIGQIQLLEGGADGDPVTLEDYQGNSSDDAPSGLAGLAEKEDISIVCVPNENDIAGLSDAVVTHCERLMDRFAILQAKFDAGDVGSLFPADGKVNSNSHFGDNLVRVFEI